MDPKNKSSLIRTLAVCIAALGCAGTLLWSGYATRFVLARGLNDSVSRPHKATLRVSDSSDACRVVMTADQALNSYEAYRRGDRFYIRIPLSSLPAADTIHGQAFSDVRVEQTPGGTVISFRLLADVTARVEQRGNKIEVSFLATRARLARSVTANGASLSSSAKRPAQSDVNQNPKPAIGSKANNASTSRAAVATRPATSPNAQKDATSVKPGLAATAKRPTVTAKTATAEPNSAGANTKETANYWFSSAQVNWLTVGLAAGLFLSLFGLVLLKRRTNSVRTLPTEAMSPDTTEVQTVIPQVTATATTSAPAAFQPPAVDEPDVREQTMSSVMSKLILDNTHRADVMNSRAPEDRRAIESSLVNIISAAETSDDERRRAREALEQYGFVAQHNATLLKGRDAWERSSAARALGAIGSKGSLPFLIEALNDTDSIVRNEAVVSIAALKDPAAIGALVEASRKHPDLAASLLSQTLNACSVDSIEWTESSSETITTGQAQVGETDETDPIELPQDDTSDSIISGWLALVDNPNDETSTEDLTSVYMLPQIERPSYEGRFLRVVA